MYEVGTVCLKLIPGVGQDVHINYTRFVIFLSLCFTLLQSSNHSQRGRITLKFLLLCHTPANVPARVNLQASAQRDCEPSRKQQVKRLSLSLCLAILVILAPSVALSVMPSLTPSLKAYFLTRAFIHSRTRIPRSPTPHQQVKSLSVFPLFY